MISPGRENKKYSKPPSNKTSVTSSNPARRHFFFSIKVNRRSCSDVSGRISYVFLVLKAEALINSASASDSPGSQTLDQFALDVCLACGRSSWRFESFFPRQTYGKLQFFGPLCFQICFFLGAPKEPRCA